VSYKLYVQNELLQNNNTNYQLSLISCNLMRSCFVK